MTKNMDMANILNLMESNIQVNSRTENKMEQAEWSALTAKKDKANGKMEKEFNGLMKNLMQLWSLNYITSRFMEKASASECF